MRIYSEKSFAHFEAWSGAEDTQQRIINEGKENTFESIIEELYPDGISETELNDLLRFDAETVFDWLGIQDENEEDEEEEPEE